MKRTVDTAESGSQSSLKDDEASLENSLEALPQLLKKRQKNLEEREQELERKMAAFEKESAQLLGDTSPNDVLHLNVGGNLTAVLRRTLTSVEGEIVWILQGRAMITPCSLFETVGLISFFYATILLKHKA